MEKTIHTFNCEKVSDNVSGTRNRPESNKQTHRRMQCHQNLL